MKILAVDVGTGTQDILLFDTRLDLENAYKLVLPSPTMIVRRRLQQATREGLAVLLTGVTMGGGPCAWAAEDHARAGLPIFATPDAARSFNDDLEAVKESGIQIVSEDEARAMPDEVMRLELRDFDFQAIRRAFEAFGVELDDLAAAAVAVFDHGAAPPDVSDRQFRFDYLDERIRAGSLRSAFAFRAESEIPPIMTRLQAVGASARASGLDGVPLIVMDTAPAAVLGAAFDPQAAALLRDGRRLVIANVGNFHTLAFRLGPGEAVEGVFEHHTGLLDLPRLEGLLLALAGGTLRHEDVFGSHGHGALIYTPEPLSLDPAAGNLIVTGPRRQMLHGSALKPHFAAPFGDMMIAGCFGLLAATAAKLPDLREPIEKALSGAPREPVTPWDVG
ncbi:MAG: pyruvate formate lyase-activating protein [Chloroflexi bacterium]|mgnify:CR=1 FL=1|nr:pyruvate formate lyase-activating protein [Chloroflexota bacterium]